MVFSFIYVSLLTLLTYRVSAYSDNYTSQLLSSGTVYLGEWKAAYQQAESFVNGLTTSEKISLISGSGVRNFTALHNKDSCASILDYFYVTTWPVGSALAMTWDKELFYKQHNALGSEFRNKGLHVVNGPVSQPMGRTPWGGRNAESFGPDSYLNGIAVGQAVRGLNNAGVIAGAKHFLLNEQETNRTTESFGTGSSSSSTSIVYSSDADDKTTHETYLWPFYDGVNAGLGAIMCSMNRVNETFACENEALVAGLLKTELGFPGFVYADYHAQKTALGSANAGLDYGSTSYWSNDTMIAALYNGSLTQSRLTDMAIRNVLPSYKLNQQNGRYPSLVDVEDYRDARKNHRQIAREVAASSIAVLKNDGVLPLKSPKTLAIFGAHAGAPVAGPTQELSVEGADDIFQGHAADIGGSGTSSFSYLVTPWYALTSKVIEDGTQFRWILNNTGYDNSSSSSGINPIMSAYMVGTGDEQTWKGYAEGMEVCIVFLNAYSGEGADRGELFNVDQDNMVTGVASHCNNTIVVINASGPRLVDNWIENKNVTALVYGSMLGQESGNAIVDVLYGDVNPSGKLIYTIAKKESDYNIDICDTEICRFTEGNYIDYKYFDKYNVTPRYEFGFGLSYTTFNYSGSIDIVKANETALRSTYASGTKAIGGREDLWDIIAQVSTSITNSGSLGGSETAQLYIKYPDIAEEPLRQLRGFEKVYVAAGQTAQVTFPLRRRDLSVWDVVVQEWAIVSGTYEVFVGASSRDLKSSGTITI